MINKYREKVSRDTIILEKEIPSLYRRRFKGIPSLYREKVSRDTIIIQGEGFKGCKHTWRGVKGIQSLYRKLRFQGI